MPPQERHVEEAILMAAKLWGNIPKDVVQTFMIEYLYERRSPTLCVLARLGKA